MVDWIDITVPEYLTPTFFNTVYNDLTYIKEQIIAPTTITAPQISMGMDIGSIIIQINIVETNIQILHSKFNDFYDLNYAIYFWTSETIYKYPEIKRWVDWINYVKGVMDGTNPKLVFLTDNSNNLLVGSDGKYILVEKE